jgi:hypothetical protein
MTADYAARPQRGKRPARPDRSLADMPIPRLVN